MVNILNHGKTCIKYMVSQIYNLQINFVFSWLPDELNLGG